MLSPERRQLLPNGEERHICKNGEGWLCHGITTEPDSEVSLNNLRQTIDWVSGHCQTVQATGRNERKELPCLKLKKIIFELEK